MSKKTQKKQPWYQALIGARRTIDEALEEAEETRDADEEETEDDGGDDESKSKTADALSKIMKKLNTMDADIKALKKTKDSESDDPEKKTEDDDEGGKTEDDVLEAEEAETLSKEGVQNYTGDSLAEVRSRMEIIVPGFKLPTLDSAKNGSAVLNAKRQVLKQAYATADGQKAITPFVGGNSNFDTLPAYTIDAAFIGASELIKAQNNAKGARSGISTQDFGRAPLTIDQINQRNREYWSNRK